jgi:hypothetical protein
MGKAALVRAGGAATAVGAGNAEGSALTAALVVSTEGPLAWRGQKAATATPTAAITATPSAKGSQLERVAAFVLGDRDPATGGAVNGGKPRAAAGAVPGAAGAGWTVGRSTEAIKA